MLINVNFRTVDADDYARGIELGLSNDEVDSLIGGCQPYNVGIYISNDLNTSNNIINKIDEYPAFRIRRKHHEKGLGFGLDLNLPHDYGLADNIQQVIDHYKTYINDEENKYAIFCTPILKSEQPEEGGFRWHKWGPYIGNHSPKHEYLFDEDNIEEILTFHIVRILQ